MLAETQLMKLLQIAPVITKAATNDINNVAEQRINQLLAKEEKT